MKQALAYNNYAPDGEGVLCCACVERDSKQHDYPHLFFCTTKPVKVDANMRCSWCKYMVGGYDAEMAAGRITKMIKGE